MPFHRTQGVTFEMSGDRIVILDAEGAVMTTINSVGSLIWQELDGERDTAALAQHLSERFPAVERADLITDIEEFLSSMSQAGLVAED